MNPELKTRSKSHPVHDKSVRNSALTPPRLRRLRHRIYLQPVGTVLVRRGRISPADAVGRQRLPVSGLPAQGGGARRGHGRDVTDSWDVRAVLLDMDGTLLDTERVYFQSLVTALNAFGYTDDVDALCHAMVGLPGPECEAMLHARYGESFPLAAINKAYVARRDEVLASGLPLKPGAVELLDALQSSECPMAIVTSSSRRTAESHLALAGIRERFETILTCDDVTRGKPSPDLYLLAALRLGVDPERCVAVEDSNHGVTAAHAAGTITIMVPDMAPPTEESRARCAAVVPDLGAVLEILHQRGGLVPHRL
jgi:HAD superfamily hydrolase (TIGR01509 family)